jgi:NAD-dependent dihydropyrimidine dehydrogenase PreA subunit
MIYVIAEPCHGTCDTACVDVCPVDCIHGPIPLDQLRASKASGGELKLQLYIDPNECISCGACEPECPVDAIFEDEELPAKWSNFAASNAEFFKNRA